ncbi:NAD-dependent epimerase/dehydratase family protein [Occultella glacieicola]|uniref:NAD-dependent epimerase/dehydratase family protein n=1 Tax=Occultella glacieicola TaxID=2518684 RepID=A0ABY2E2N3_9MICO|nr:NAD-dependent epimerase/dehydratase family protein [Occultella glacieicola]TDE93879.1 NAD-dependent epimerase/dehydratase family protein [Occultella glacieicola]
MARIVVLGAGPIGATTASRYAARGDRVTVVTRSGSGPHRPGIDRVALDVAAGGLGEVAAGASVIVNAVNLPYRQWQAGWPPIHREVMGAAESSGAVLALVGNFYVYPAGSSPMSARTPIDPPTRKGAIRARIWADLVAAHRAGRIRTLELRGSDYVGAQVVSTDGAHAGPRLVDPVLRGRRAAVVGDPDAAHTWTAVDDIARTILTLAEDERAWGRAWHVPSAPARSIRQVAEDVAAAGGLPRARVSRIPRPVLRLLGLAQPQLGEIIEMLYQFDAPFVATHEETTEVFGVTFTAWEETVAAIVAAARARITGGRARTAVGATQSP